MVRTPTTSMGFADVIGSVAPTKAYVFGQSVAAPTGTIALRNTTDLAAYFNPFEDFTGRTSINSELARYQDFNAVNHAFASDRLNLVGAVAGGASWNGFVSAPTYVDLSGNPNSIATLGLTSTSGMRVGQLAALEYKGLYFISALVTDVSISLQPLGGSPTSPQYYQLIFWLPIDSAPLSAPAGAGASVLYFASAPAGATVGAALSVVTSTYVSTRSAEYRVTGTAGSTVSVSPGLNEGSLGTGTRILFMPLVTSGQIWSRDQFSLADSSTFLAIEFDVDVMGGSNTYQTNGINTASGYAAAPADVPWGAWPALWVYSANDGLYEARDNSEIDVLEMNWSGTSGPNTYMGNNHGPAVGSHIYDKTDAGWSWNSTYDFDTAPSPVSGAHKFQLVYSNGATWRYIDGVLIKAANYRWTSGAPVQIGINLAIGSLEYYEAANLLLPIATSNFAGQTLGVKGLRIWKE